MQIKILSELFNFYSPWNHQKTYGFLMIPGGMWRYLIRLNSLNIRNKIWGRSLTNQSKHQKQKSYLICAYLIFHLSVCLEKYNVNANHIAFLVIWSSLNFASSTYCNLIFSGWHWIYRRSFGEASRIFQTTRHWKTSLLLSVWR